MQYEVWKKWYNEAMLRGDARTLKRLRKIGILHGWIEDDKGKRRKKIENFRSWYFRKE